MGFNKKLDSVEGAAVESPRSRARFGLAGLVATGALAIGIAIGGAGAGITSAQADSAAADATATAVSAASEDTTLAEEVAAKVMPSVGSVYAEISSNGQQGVAQGSCEVISADGYIVTNYHVIEGATQVQVILNDISYDAEVVGSDPTSDVAVLKIDAGDTQLTPIEIGDSSQLKVGQWVMTVGSPYGESGSVSVGIVSGLARTASVELDDGEAYYVGAIQSDAMINAGSSGGAMVNEDGQFVGMTTYATTTSGDWAGMSYAIPSNYVMDVAQQIIENGTVEHPQLGVTVADLIDAYYQGAYSMPSTSSVTGAYVTGVTEGSGAAEAGVQAGDVITALNGNAIYSADDLIIQIRSNSIGDTVTLTVERDGQELDLQVTLGSDADSTTTGTPAENPGTGWSNGGSWGWGNGSQGWGWGDGSQGGWSWPGWGWGWGGQQGQTSGSFGPDAGANA